MGEIILAPTAARVTITQVPATRLNEMRDWTELDVFEGVDLCESFVLSWKIEESFLRVDLDLVLRPEHAFYEKPRPAERKCFRPGVLVFSNCGKV